MLKGLTVVQQSAFPSMQRSRVTERRPWPHVTRQNKRCQSPHPPPSLLSHIHTHTHTQKNTHRLLSRLKFICCIQMPATNYTCGWVSEWASKREKEGREKRGYYGAFDTVAIARQHCIDPFWKRSGRSCVFFYISLSFSLSVPCSWFWKIKGVKGQCSKSLNLKA